MNAAVADVGETQSHAPGQLLLNAQVVLNHVGAFAVVVHELRRDIRLRVQDRGC